MPGAEHLDLDGSPELRPVGGHVRERERAAHSVAVVATGDTPDDLTVDSYRLGPERHRQRVERPDAPQPASDALGLDPPERVLADERRRMVERDCEPEPGLVRIVLRRDVRRPHPVALLHAQRVDRAITTGAEIVRGAGIPQQIPERAAVFGRAVQLPPELADVRDAQRDGRDGAERDRLRGQVRKRVVGQRR